MASAILFIPFYLKLLNFESFSIISFSILLFSIITILDSGMTGSLSRELARKDTDPETIKTTFNTLRTTYLFVTFFIIVVLLLFSETIAIIFVKSKSFSFESLVFNIRIIAVGIGFQMLLNFSIAGILALDKQVFANTLLICWGLIRNGLVVLVLYFYPRLDIFFIWQTLTTVIFSIIALFYLTIFVKGRFDFNLSFDKSNFKRIWRFTFGMFFLTILAVMNQQLDKVILSYALPVNQLGYYSLAFTISLLLISSVNPLAVTILPRLTSYFTDNNTKEAIKLFIFFQKVSLIIILSLSLNLLFFSYEFLHLWLRDRIVARTVSEFLPFIVLGYTFNGASVMLYNVVIANGYTKLNIKLTTIMVIVTTPLYFSFIKYYQLIGASWVFCFGQFFYIIPYYYFINQKYLKLNFKELILTPIFKPLLISSILVGSLKYFKFQDGHLFNFLYLSISIILCFAINILVCFKGNDLTKTLKSKLLLGG